MREATGELNMTVIVIVILAALVVVATTIVVPTITAGLRRNSCASALGLSANQVTVNSDAGTCCETANAANCITLEQAEEG